MEKNYLNELKIAFEFLDVSKNNLNSSLKTSANRIYFALERAVVSYLYFKKINIPKNHQKLWELSSEFLGDGFYKILRELYDLRMQADYGIVSVFVVLNKDILKKYLIEVEFLINKIKSLVENEK